MDFQKALQILNLNPNFTEEDLKKAYRELANKYHPDRNKTTDAEEKMKEINAAREYLRNYLKNNYSNYDSHTYAQNTQYQSTFNIEMYILKKYSELEKIINFNFYEYNVSENIKNIIEKMNQPLFMFGIRVNFLKNKKEIDDAFNKCLEEIKPLFKELETKFYKENDIDKNDVEENVNYDCTLKEFYEQLLKIKKQYSKKSMMDTKYRELKNIVNFDFTEYKLSENIKNIIEEMQNEVNEIEFSLKDATDKQNIDNIFNRCLVKIKTLFKKIETEFYQETGIEKNNITETINYDCTLKEFYKQLLKIKDKYSKESLVNKLLEEEISKYTNYAGYERIKVSVRYCKTKTLNKIKANNFVYNQKDIDDMHQSILDCFNRYYSIEQKIFALENKITTIDNQEIKYKFIKIKEKFKTTVKFDDIEKNIQELEAQIEKYLSAKEEEEQTNFKNLESKINEIYINLITRYSETTKGYNVLTQNSEANRLNDFLNRILELFKQGIKDEQTLDFFIMFDGITFKDAEKDNKLIEKINKVLNMKKTNVYIKTKHNNFFDDISFFYLNEKDMIMYKIEPHNRQLGISSKHITQDDLEQEYISLQQFLDKSTFIGENKTDYLGARYGVIYEFDGYSLFLQNHTFHIGYKMKFFKASHREYTYMDEFKDKNHLISLIEQQIQKRFEEQLQSISTQNTQTSESKTNKHYALKTYEDGFGESKHHYTLKTYEDGFKDSTHRGR